MHVRTRRLIVRSLAVVIVCVLAVGVRRLADTLAVGVGYKAKMLCSGVFVSRLDPETVLSDLQADDLAVLKYIRASINPDANDVTASFMGTVTRRAVYRKGLGCALVLAGFHPPALPDSQSSREVSGEAAPLPRGSEPPTASPDEAGSGSVTRYRPRRRTK
jgi:hypothetical protein